MKKHYILIWIELPGQATNPAENDKLKHWNKLSPRLAMLAKNSEDIVTLSQNAWLIPRDGGLPFVGECMGSASMPLLKVHTLFLDEDA
jgi:hypothetical protein